MLIRKSISRNSRHLQSWNPIIAKWWKQSPVGWKLPRKLAAKPELLIAENIRTAKVFVRLLSTKSYRKPTMAGVFGFAGDGVRFTAAFGRRSVSSGEKCKVHENRQSAAFFFCCWQDGNNRRLLLSPSRGAWVEASQSARRRYWADCTSLTSLV